MSAIEEWRSIKDFEGLYEVSSLGRVRSLQRMVRNRYSTALRGGKVLHPTPDRGGYLFVMLSVPNPNRIFCKKVHRLAAAAFLWEPPDGKAHVNHIDFDRTNNAASNLEWCNVEENVSHTVRAGRFDGTISPRRGKKLTAESASAIKQRRAAGESVADLAAEFMIHPRNIRRIAAGQVWRRA